MKWVAPDWLSFSGERFRLPDKPGRPTTVTYPRGKRGVIFLFMAIISCHRTPSSSPSHVADLSAEKFDDDHGLGLGLGPGPVSHLLTWYSSVPAA